MSKHMDEWLSAYLDGELHGSRLAQVEEHLADCPTCQAKLESLSELSHLLQEIPAPKFTSPQRLASRVSLHLPHRPVTPSGRRFLEFGWWMIPVTLVAAWIFLNTTFLVSDVLRAAGSLGVAAGISDWFSSGPSNDIYLSTTIGQMGLLGGSGLNWAEITETVARMSLPQITLQISIALLYLSWIAVWWARHTRQGHGQLLKG